MIIFCGKFNANRPVLIDLGKIELHNPDRHTVVIIGYKLSGTSPDEDMTLYYLDPL